MADFLINPMTATVVPDEGEWADLQDPDATFEVTYEDLSG